MITKPPLIFKRWAALNRTPSKGQMKVSRPMDENLMKTACPGKAEWAVFIRLKRWGGFAAQELAMYAVSTQKSALFWQSGENYLDYSLNSLFLSCMKNNGMV